MYRIETEDLGRKVYKVLRSMIINGDLRSGEKLVQDDLAERLGVSRTPLQFAISKLEQENLVETLPRQYAYAGRYAGRCFRIFPVVLRLSCGTACPMTRDGVSTLPIPPG